MMIVRLWFVPIALLIVDPALAQPKSSPIYQCKDGDNRRSSDSPIVGCKEQYVSSGSTPRPYLPPATEDDIARAEEAKRAEREAIHGEPASRYQAHS